MYNADRGHPDGSGIRAMVDVVEAIGHESTVYASSGSKQIVAIFDPLVTPRPGVAGSERSLLPAEA